MKPALDTSEALLVSPEEALTARKRLVGDGLMVLMVGRLSQIRKGFDLAIEAFPLIRHAAPTARLAIVGPGETSTLRIRARGLGIAESVIFTGEVDRKQLLSLYAACDVFLLPTRTMPDGDVEVWNRLP